MSLQEKLIYKSIYEYPFCKLTELYWLLVFFDSYLHSKKSFYVTDVEIAGVKYQIPIKTEGNPTGIVAIGSCFYIVSIEKGIVQIGRKLNLIPSIIQLIELQLSPEPGSSYSLPHLDLPSLVDNTIYSSYPDIRYPPNEISELDENSIAFFLYFFLQEEHIFKSNALLSLLLNSLRNLGIDYPGFLEVLNRIESTKYSFKKENLEELNNYIKQNL